MGLVKDNTEAALTIPINVYGLQIKTKAPAGHNQVKHVVVMNEVYLL